MSEVNEGTLNNLTTYQFFEQNDCNVDTTQTIVSENEVSSLFFSDHNVNTLHEGIRYSVYKGTNNHAVIDRQSDNELRVIMRSIYLQYARHLPYRVVDQVKELNTRVLDFAVPRILVELNQYANYTHHASTLPIPLEHSKNVSNKGQRVLYMNEF
jgi:hypothetical protein